jgi:hypothetical protein
MSILKAYLVKGVFVRIFFTFVCQAANAPGRDFDRLGVQQLYKDVFQQPARVITEPYKFYRLKSWLFGARAVPCWSKCVTNRSMLSLVL